ncbi:MAG: tripartite tricarboxylate transporter permease, partial [Deltaproteobacteria bacterium]|nr:tripartite tricarboxylate transporter permease [Deltaproteobacteria bacterium]
YTIVLGNLIVVPIMFVFASWLCRIAVVPANILAPIVIGIVSLSALATNSSMSDLVAVLAFGSLGVFMKLYAWPRPPILIAVVLADVLERFLWISINNYGFGMLARPQFLIILVLMIAATAFGLQAQRGARLAMKSSDSEPDTAATKTEARTANSFKIEVAGEAILLFVVGAFFVYLFVDSWNWPLDAALMPRIAVILGFPFWLVRVVTLLRFPGSKGAGVTEIMDTGFILGVDPKAETRRFARIIGFTLLLYGGIWLIGIHITLPITMFFYLLIYGRAGWIWSAVTALVFLGLIVGFYDWILNIVWPDVLLAYLLP